MNYYFKILKPFRYFILLGVLAVISCNKKKDQTAVIENDLTKLGLKGPIKSIKVRYYGLKQLGLREFVKNDTPTLDMFRWDNNFLNPALNWIEFNVNPLPSTNTSFTYDGFIWAEVHLDRKGVSSFTGNRYNNQNKITRTTFSYDIDNISSKDTGTIWSSVKSESIDTIIYHDSTAEKYSKHGFGKFYLSEKDIYNKQNKLIEKKEYSDSGNVIRRIVYEYDHKETIISESKYEKLLGLENYSKNLYEYYSDKKITKTINVNTPINNPSVTTEYFDSTGKNVIKKILYNGDLETYDYDKSGNLIAMTRTKQGAFGYIDDYKSKYVYTEFDQFGNWTKRAAYVYNNFTSEYEQANEIERTIEPYEEILARKENNSLQNAGVFIGISGPLFVFFILPVILGGLFSFTSSVFGKNKTLDDFFLLFSTLLISLMLFLIVGSVSYLSTASFEFEKYSKFWWIINLVAIIGLFLWYPFLKIETSDVKKEFSTPKEYSHSSYRKRFNYYIDYSRIFLSKMMFLPSVIYLFLLIFNVSTENDYLNIIKNFIINNF